MSNTAIFMRAQGRFAMIAFWALIGTYTYVKYLT
jgi:hypothetical protein